MAIKIVPYAKKHVEAVLAFNRRMSEGGSDWGWYETCDDDWLPPNKAPNVWREHYLALEDDKTVRGAYALKPQEWLVRGKSTLVTDWQGPVSEGVLSRRHAPLGLRMIRDMLKKQPLLYSWGHGGHEAAMLQLLVSLKWLIHETPFCLKVLHPYRFLRRNAYLRDTMRRRLLLDLLAFSGIGWLGFKLTHWARGLSGPSSPNLTFEVVPEFGQWADILWNRCKGAYQALGARDARTMNALVPEGSWPRGIRLRIKRGTEDIGWAVVLDNQLNDDGRFGDLRVGCVADCLALPEDAAFVVAAATHFLENRGVDMIGANQSHPAWISAFASTGFLVLKNRRCFAVSPGLQKALSPFDETKLGLHLTNMDGHGPHGF